MHHITTTNLGGREHLLVSVAGDPGADIQAQARGAMDKAIALIVAAGYAPGHIVRSRIFARDATSRRAASDLRLEILKGDLRAASSSYIDPGRLPGGCDVAVDLVAARAPSSSRKLVKEYEPRIAPPMFVALDGLIYVSGCTDTSEGFAAQLANVRSYVTKNLEAAGAGWGDIVAVSAHVSRKVNGADAWRSFSALFPGMNGPISISPVDGYSAPEKLLEIEATAKQ